MGLGIFARIEYETYLTKLKDKTPNAESQEITHCIQCGWCCARRPCRPTPIEVEVIAKYLEMPVHDFVSRYLVIDRFGNPTWFLYPAKTTQEDITGTTVPAERTFDTGYCIFYNHNKKECEIYPVRPREALLSNCWENEDTSMSWTVTLLESWDLLSEEDWKTRFGVFPNDEE